ncbi:uncharacterized protein PHALS_08387 [Plasmopara halstedii]|uniref:Uncharacterized protein n=1 Tax=Plasmopara halstedii TaxID=4781 RepID=A0A0P1ACP5_PLAHL|nr:uncharacterized protein PHALS_08387 [Plasmopara halstedii]CEG38306.1 hypothetical protein PHALS_08387 [Plasmopara halstedii]|eukprot:XP_024574675.1 hypothetical protein PHALS_08387 [Plasmopara halstedii]
MGLGTVTLLEIKKVPNSKRIAFCLPSGEFIVVTDTCAPDFGANNAADLYGCNLFQFLMLRDAEKLEDFLHAQHTDNSNGSGLVVNRSQQMRLMVRLSRNPRTQLCIQLSDTPLTLRMMRCIDTIRSLSHPLGLFADSSSFVLSEDEFSTLLRHSLHNKDSLCSPNHASQAEALMSTEDDDDLTFLEIEDSCMSPASFTSVVPVELKHRNSSLDMTQNGLDVNSEESDHDLRASLSDLAFEADWSSETLQDDGFVSPQPVTPISSDTSYMPTSKPDLRAEVFS